MTMSTIESLLKNDNRVTVEVASGDALDVRRFAIRERMSELFTVTVTAVSNILDVKFDEVIGKEASFTLRTDWTTRVYRGVASAMRLVRVDDEGLATYQLELRPRAWLMGHRTNFRIFQYMSELAIVSQLLGEWGVPFSARVDGGAHKGRKFRVQYGESDLVFVQRMLEDAGISYSFELGEATTMVLDDAPEAREAAHAGVRFFDEPQVVDVPFVTKLAVGQRVRPGAAAIGDLDYRRPSASQPRLASSRGLAVETSLEQFDHEPGAFLYEGGGGGATPTADDRGTARTDEGAGSRKVENRLAGHRQRARTLRFESNVLDLAPGSTLGVVGHPHRLLAGGVLVTESSIEGAHSDAWRVRVEAVPTSAPFRPEPVTPKPRIPGLESATVVGPGGEEIHTDEYGRARVQFHWDREGKSDESSSCWLPSSQPWAGSGFGSISLARIGQEVLVQFLNGDPDRPVIIGRVFTKTNPPPDKLPDFKEVTGFMSESTPRMVMGGADGPPAGGADSLLGGGTPMDSGGIDKIVGDKSSPFQAHSPTGANHNWQGSGLKFQDMYGSGTIYLQAQKDFNLLVNNCWRTNVRNNRGTLIGTDDQLKVGNRSSTIVKGNQSIEVKQNQKLKVTKRRGEEIDETLGLEVGADGFHVRSKDETITLRAKYHDLMIQAKTKITLKVGASSIVMTEDRIVIQSAQTVLQRGEGGG